MKANASLAANRTLSSIEKEIEAMLTEADAKDREEDAAFGADKRGDELPEELQDRASRREGESRRTFRRRNRWNASC